MHFPSGYAILGRSLIPPAHQFAERVTNLGANATFTGSSSGAIMLNDIIILSIEYVLYSGLLLASLDFDMNEAPDQILRLFFVDTL